MKKNISKYIVKKTITLEKACHLINKSQKKSLIIIDSKKKVIGLINDGDIRRGLIKGYSVKDQIFKVMNKNPYTIHYDKITNINYNFFNKKKIDILPVLKKGRIYDVLTKEEFLIQKSNHNHVVINTGGLGTRLKPYTNKKNKILVNVANKKNIGDLLINRFTKQGFNDFIFLTNHRSPQVKKYFSQKYKKNNLSFVKEQKPLGTCGALSQLKYNQISDNFIFINCDIVSYIDYNQLINFHVQSNLDLTIVSAQKKLKLDYGNINFKGLNFYDICEKPELIFTVNAGIYVINKEILKYLSKNKKIDMPNFIKVLKKRRKKISVYPTFEYWLDVGTPQKLLEYKKKIIK